jgi:hypothetical protein
MSEQHGKDGHSGHDASQDKHDEGKGHPTPMYRFRVDKATFETDQQYLIGAAILAIAGIEPSQVILVRAMKGGERVPVDATASVDLAHPGLERFFTMKAEHTNGWDPSRREFEMLDDDVACLDSTGLEWEARLIAGERWIFLRRFPLPTGLEPCESDMGLRLSANYPMTQIDMAYFNPPLRHAHGRDIPNLAMTTVGDASWQQWSRHRPDGSWRPGVDDVETHLAFVRHFLAAAASP